MSDIKKFMDIMMETTAGATSSGSVAEVSQSMMSTQRRVNPSIYTNQSSKSDDHCPECKCNPCECHEESRKAPDAPKAKEFGLWQNSVLAGKAQKEKKAKKATNESVKILKTTKTPTGKQVQGNYGLDYQPEEKLDMYGHSMRGSPKLHSPRIPDNKYPGQGPGRPENISSTDAFDVLKKDPFGRDNSMTEDDLEEDWEGIKNAGKKAIGAGAIGLAALGGGGTQAQTVPANTGTNVAQTQSVSSNAAIVKSLANPEARQRFLKQHSDTTAQLKDPKYDHNPDALAQHAAYPKEQHSQWIQNVKNVAQFQNPYQIIRIALNMAGLTPQEVLQNLPKGYKLPSTEPKSETVRIPGDPGYKASVNEFKKSSRSINELECGQGQRKLKLAEVDKDNKKSIGPNKNDPYEKGWRAGFRHDESNPYPTGSKQAAQWDRGYAEAESQPNHYDESVMEAVEDHTKIKVDKISSKYPGTNILTGSSTVRVGRKGKTPIGTFPTFEIDGHRYISLADGNKIERALRQDVAEGSGQQLSVQQLATISDEALDNAYHYGRSTPGNTFGWQANLKSAAYAKQMIDKGVTDIEAISNAIHKGWNVTAKAFVQNPDQFDDTKKLKAAGKLEAKLQQRAKLMNIGYAQLPDDEQEKDRVVARALLQAMKGQQGVSEDLDEDVGGNYLYHATGGLKNILASGQINASDFGKEQNATLAQTQLPTVAVTRDWNYAIGGKSVASQLSGIGRQAIIVLDRNAVESNFKTLGTSQSSDLRGTANPMATRLSSVEIAKAKERMKNDPAAERERNRVELARSNRQMKGRHAMYSTIKFPDDPGAELQRDKDWHTPKAGQEFEEAVVVPKGGLPIKRTMVGFYIPPSGLLMKDPAVMNDPRRLDLEKGGTGRFVKAAQQSVQQAVAEATGDEKFDNMMGGIVQGVKKPSIGSRLMAPFKRMKDRGQVVAQSRFYKQMIDKYHNLASDSMNSTSDYEFDDERRFPHEEQFSKYMYIARYFEMLRGDEKLHAPFIQNIRKNNPELAKYQPLNAGKNSDSYAEPALPRWVPKHNSIIDIEHRPVKITHIGRPVDHLGVEWLSAYERKHYEEFFIEDFENFQDFLIQVEDEINFNDEKEGREGYGRDLDEAANAAQQAAIAIAKKKKDMTKQVDEIDMSVVGDALAGAAIGAGSVGVGSYIGHKIANKFGQKFIDRANRKEAERQAKYDKEQCFGGSCDLDNLDMYDWDDDEDLEEGKTGPGLWANIHKKQNRIKNGSGEHMRKPGSKGAPTSANFKAAAKTEGMSAKIKPIQELSSATLDRYKEKAKKSSDELTRQGKYRKANDRTMNVMKATGKQIDNTVSSIRKSLRNDKSVAEGSNTKVTKTSSDIRAINKAAMKEISSLKKSKR